MGAVDSAPCTVLKSRIPSLFRAISIITKSLDTNYKQGGGGQLKFYLYEKGGGAFKPC